VRVVSVGAVYVVPYGWPPPQLHAVVERSGTTSRIIASPIGKLPFETLVVRPRSEDYSHPVFVPILRYNSSATDGEGYRPTLFTGERIDRGE
jgi:hypothetical protein